MKKIIVAILASVMVFALCACGGSADTSKDGDAKEKTEQTQASKDENKETVYKVGDTWTVDGQWKLTIDSVEATDERNEFEDSTPAQVIKIAYTYENIGYEDESGFMDGLLIDLSTDGKLVDAGGNVCESYALGDIFATEVPVDAKGTFEEYFALQEAGSPVKLMLSLYDGNSDTQKATFELSF